MKRVWISILFVFVAACGKAAPDFSEPADGQVFDLSQQNIQPRAVLANNEYDGVTIEFRIPPRLAQALSCQTTQSQPYAYCQRLPGQANCSAQDPCEVLVIARNDSGQTAFRTMRFQTGTR